MSGVQLPCESVLWLIIPLGFYASANLHVLVALIWCDVVLNKPFLVLHSLTKLPPRVLVVENDAKLIRASCLSVCLCTCSVLSFKDCVCVCARTQNQSLWLRSCTEGVQKHRKKANEYAANGEGSQYPCGRMFRCRGDLTRHRRFCNGGEDTV